MLLKVLQVFLQCILNAFNSERQLKNNESAINSKLIDLLTQLKGFNFATTLG